MKTKMTIQSTAYHSNNLRNDWGCICEDQQIHISFGLHSFGYGLPIFDHYWAYDDVKNKFTLRVGDEEVNANIWKQR